MPMPAVAPVERVELVRLFQYGIPRPEHADPTLQVLQVSGGPAPKWGPPSSWEPPLLRIGQETQLEKYLRLQGIEPREGRPCPILELTNLDYNPKVFRCEVQLGDRTLTAASTGARGPAGSAWPGLPPARSLSLTGRSCRSLLRSSEANPRHVFFPLPLEMTPAGGGEPAEVSELNHILS